MLKGTVTVIEWELDLQPPICNQCLSLLMVWFGISIRARCTALCDKACQWPATGQWFSPGPPVSSTNKTDRHDITEILLKAALNTIKQTKSCVIFTNNTPQRTQWDRLNKHNRKPKGQTRDHGNIGHKTQDADKQNIQNTTQHRKLKRLATRPPPKIGGESASVLLFRCIEFPLSKFTLVLSFHK